MPKTYDEHEHDYEKDKESKLFERSTLLKNFLGYTSAHGFADCQRTRTVWRLVWIGALFAAWGICSWQIYGTVTDYYAYPTTTSISLAYMAEAKFPAVTICNVNQIKKSIVENFDRNGKMGIMKQLEAVKKKMNAKHGSGWTEDSQSSKKARDERSMIQRDIREQIFNAKVDMSMAGHEIEDMLLECSYQGYECAPSDFKQWQHPIYGSCYTYFANSTNYSTFYGPEYGLQLALFAETKEYMPLMSDSVGFRVQISSEAYPPFPGDLGFTISPGLSTSIAVKQQEIIRQPLPYDNTNCETTALYKSYEYWDTVIGYAQNYTAGACYKSCMHHLVVDKCGCVDGVGLTHTQAFQLFNNSTRTCNSTDFQCVIGLNSQADVCSDECPQSCHETQFLTRATASLWPSDDYFTSMLGIWMNRARELCPTVKDIVNMTAVVDIECPSGKLFMYGTNPEAKPTDQEQRRLDDALRTTTTSAREMIAKLEVFYEELNHELIAEAPTYTYTTFLSSLGGTLGLYSGLSTLSILQFIELAARMIYPGRVHDQ